MSRRRGTRLEHAILDAAWDLLNEVGYAKLTMEAVAANAGTSRPVIHRRWPTRAQLALAAVEHRAPLEADPPDTGSLRTDLLTLMRRLVSRANAVHGEVLAGLAAETARDPDAMQALRARLAAPTQGRHVTAIVQRAIDRGELPAVRLPARLTRLPTDLVRNEIFLYGQPPGPSDLAEIVDRVILPALHHAPTQPSGS